MRIMDCLKKKKEGYKKPVPDITVSELISFLLHYQGQRSIKACVGHKDETYRITGMSEQDGQLILTVQKSN